jgi:tetratricopeptide (TPR) repeat protein
MSRMETLVHDEFDYNSAATLMGEYLAQDSQFKDYAAQSVDLVGDLCQAVYLTGGDYFRITSLCEDAYYNNIPFQIYILINDARNYGNYGSTQEAAQLLQEAYEKVQALGTRPEAPYGDALYTICYAAADFQLVEEFGEICEQSGISLVSQIRQDEALRLNSELESLILHQDILAAYDLIRQNGSEAPFFSMDQVLSFCDAADQAGQFDLVETTCASYGIDQADLDLQGMLGKMTVLLNSGRIDDALLLFNKILDTTPANLLPDRAWDDLCYYGVEAGQYYKVRGACARVRRPAG